MEPRYLTLALTTLLACSRTDGVDVRPGEASLTGASVDRAPETDFQIARRVESALASDPGVSLAARNVHVDVSHRVVTLLGSVDDPSSKDLVGSVAENVPHTAGALNKVDVSPSRNEGDTESDETIAESLERSLALDPELAPDADAITIEVIGGVVSLRGAVSNPRVTTVIESIGERTPGVVAISNQLRLISGGDAATRGVSPDQGALWMR